MCSKIRLPLPEFIKLSLQAIYSIIFHRKINVAMEEGICTGPWNLNVVDLNMTNILNILDARYVAEILEQNPLYQDPSVFSCSFQIICRCKTLSGTFID